MIPWDTFKTPQDAYEWAQKNANKEVCLVGGWPCSKAWTVWGRSIFWGWDPQFSSKVTR